MFTCQSVWTDFARRRAKLSTYYLWSSLPPPTPSRRHHRRKTPLSPVDDPHEPAPFSIKVRGPLPPAFRGISRPSGLQNWNCTGSALPRRQEREGLRDKSGADQYAARVAVVVQVRGWRSERVNVSFKSKNVRKRVLWTNELQVVRTFKQLLIVWDKSKAFFWEQSSTYGLAALQLSSSCSLEVPSSISSVVLLPKKLQTFAYSSLFACERQRSV